MVSPCSKFVGTNPHGLIGISRARLCLLRQVAQRRILVAAEPSASPGSEAKNSNVRRPRRKAASAPAGDVPTAGGTPPAAPPSQPKRQRRQTPTLKQQKVAKLPQPVEEQQRQATKRRRRRPQQPPPLEQQQVAVPAQQQPAPKQGPPAALAVAQQAAAGALQRQLPRKQQPRQPTSTTSPRQAPEGQHPPRQQQQQRQRQQQREPAEPAGQQQREAAHATRQLPSVDDAPPPDWAAMEGRLSAALEAAGEAEALARDRKRGQELQRQQRRQRLEKLLLLLQQQQQQQAQAQEQPTWTVEGAEALCYLGMAPEQAVQALSAAHAYATRRQQQAAEAAEQSAAGAAEAAGSQPGQQAGAAVAGRGSLALVPPVSAGQVEAVSRELTATAKVPVAQLRHVLETSPQLLACTPAELRKQHEVVASVWRRPRRLAAAILEHPGMLSPDFPAELGRSLQDLSSLGFSREQVSAAILRYPTVTQLTRRDVVRHLSQAGLDLGKSTSEVLQFLAEHPHVLGAEGGAALCSRLALFSTWRLPAPLCPLLLARCPLLLREPEAQMQGIVDILMGYGCTWRQLSDVVLGYPSVLRLNPSIVRLTLKLLADFEIGLDKVAQYPRVFIHDPVNYIGPRLAYLKAFVPAKLRFRLVSILSRGDDEFAGGFCGRLEDEYAVFKDAWVRQYQEQVNLPAGRSSLSRRMWSREITDELWL